MASATTRTTKSKDVKAGRRRLRLLWTVVFILGVVYLYYRPISSYFETRHELATRRAEVQSLRAVRTELDLRLANFGKTDSLEREARRIDYVKPGERLFVVKGIAEWRRTRASRER